MNLKTTFAQLCLLLGLLIASLDLMGFVCPPTALAATIDSTDLPTNTTHDEDILKGVDGPYLFKKRKKIREIRVVANGKNYEIEEIIYNAKKQTTFTCEVENEDRDVFSFQLMKKIIPPKSTYKQPAKLLAISDIEGNFDAFYSLLLANKVMNEAYEWTYGEGHLVLVGDFVDRGINVTPCLWLIYKLEQEAKKNGGVVHFILGNHEILNFQGTTEYVDNKYIALAHKISGKEDEEKAYLYLMSNQRELVKWMKSKNVIERIGRTIFVHGGISKALISANMSLGEMNQFIRSNAYVANHFDESEENLCRFLCGPLGPLWYRGLVGRYKKMYKKITTDDLKRTLRYFQADQVVIGHTVVSEVSSDYDGRVYRIDIGFPPMKDTGKSQGLLIENQQFFRVNDFGEKVLLN